MDFASDDDWLAFALEDDVVAFASEDGFDFVFKDDLLAFASDEVFSLHTIHKPIPRSGIVRGGKTQHNIFLHFPQTSLNFCPCLGCYVLDKLLHHLLFSQPQPCSCLIQILPGHFFGHSRIILLIVHLSPSFAVLTCSCSSLVTISSVFMFLQFIRRKPSLCLPSHSPCSNRWVIWSSSDSILFVQGTNMLSCSLLACLVRISHSLISISVVCHAIPNGTDSKSPHYKFLLFFFVCFLIFAEKVSGLIFWVFKLKKSMSSVTPPNRDLKSNITSLWFAKTGWIDFNHIIWKWFPWWLIASFLPTTHTVETAHLSHYDSP